MKLPILLITGLMLFYPAAGFAQSVEGVQSFSQPEGSWKRENQATEEEVKPQQRFTTKPASLPSITSSTPNRSSVMKFFRKTTNMKVTHWTVFRFAVSAA